MKRFLALTLAVVAAASVSTAFARVAPSERVMKFEDDARALGLGSDMPAAQPDGFARADTFNYGYYQTISGVKYAVPGDSWSFDHGAPDPFEGWYAVDLSANPVAYFQRITPTSWSGHTNAVNAPIAAGSGAAWIGAFEDQADALCWEAGLGYGNSWCQRWTSPALTYTGTGDVTLTFDYFNDTEPNFDYTALKLRLGNGDEVAMNGLGFTDRVGITAGNFPTFEAANFTAFNAQFAGQTSFRFVFEFTSDGGWSDEDASYSTDYGPFAVDNINISGSVTGGPITYDYESSDGGWAASTCSPIGTFFGINNLSNYTVLDPCACNLAGNVMSFHQGTGDAGTHVYGQHVLAYSPPADKSTLGAGCFTILADWDQYSVQPRANGVFHRPGWNFFPFVCPETGVSQWSGRKGQDTFNSTGDDPNCFRNRNIGTDWGIPGDCQQVAFVFETYASCDAFGIPSTVCTNVTNFTPLIDNVQIRVTQQPCAPRVAFDPGTYFQDGYGQALLLSTTNAGNADITYDLSRDTTDPDQLGDSLMIKGPTPTSSTKWESRMYWRMRREGPGQSGVSGYAVWKAQIADGFSIVGDNAQFAVGLMDSAQNGTNPFRDRFISEFREQDDDFQGENANNNEMLRDGILAPGTQVQYFITANYTCTPNDAFYLPDTAGKNFLEFEILPAWRTVSGEAKFPCILFVDLNTGNQGYVERALSNLVGDSRPDPDTYNPAPWDRFDYADPTSNWNAPLARSVNGNNGAGLVQFLGYRMVLLSTGRTTNGTMETPDFTMMSDWLTAIVCNSNTSRQGFYGNGDNTVNLIGSINPAFLVNNLGATLKCDSYNLDNCGPTTPADESFCVRLNNAPGGQYSPLANFDAFGNWCPQKFTFDVLNATGGGIGNRVFNDYDRVPPTNTNYAQIVKSVTGANSDNYRTVVDAVSWDHMSTRDVSLECVGDTAHIVPAIQNEISAAFTWIFGSGGGGTPSFCINPCTSVDVDSDTPVVTGPATRLFQNTPNPFNPRTSIRFSLAAGGPAELFIYDVNGRKVKTLVSGNLTAGEHTEVWDGTDDAGRKVGAGVYWSQLKAGGYESNKKMVVLK
ncbi:MAG: T9SS type A sorting domain-containing protein [Candidatus Eisenbacteria bacterium]|nr:T9SS type A sorting domain-containing protein [Candidatus Eisenbacteria bacterium]